MRTLFLYRSWRDRFASSGRFRLRTFAERSVEHLKRWPFIYAAVGAIALWFHAHYGFGLNATSLRAWSRIRYTPITSTKIGM